MSTEFDLLTYGSAQGYEYFRNHRENVKFLKQRRKTLKEHLRWVKSRVAYGGMEELKKISPLCIEIPRFETQEKLPADGVFDFAESYDLPSFNISYRMDMLVISRGRNSADESCHFRVYFETKKANEKNAIFNLFHMHEHLKDIVFHDRKLGFNLDPYTPDVVFITSKTTKNDILIQLIVFALQREFLKQNDEANKYLVSYIKSAVGFPRGINKHSREEIINDTINKLLSRYLMPFEPWSFKAYIRATIGALLKNKRRKDKKAHDFARELDKEYLRFTLDDDKHLYGIDRVAIETGISRDTLYRHIRSGKLAACSFDHNGRKYLTLTKSQIKELMESIVAKKTLIKSLAEKRMITEASARKHITRKLKRGLTLKNIYMGKNSQK